MDAYTRAYKIIVLGDGSVGKSSIIKRFVFNEFDFNTMLTVGVSSYPVIINSNEENIMLNIWDTAGQEKYQSIVPSYFRGSHAALIVYDITNEESFKRVSYWIKQAKEYAGDDICLLLVGNKLDLESKRAVLQKYAIDISKANNMLYFETSCLNSTNVERAFDAIVEFLTRNIIKINTPNGSVLSDNAKKISILLQPEAVNIKSEKACCRSS